MKLRVRTMTGTSLQWHHFLRRNINANQKTCEVVYMDILERSQWHTKSYCFSMGLRALSYGNTLFLVNCNKVDSLWKNRNIVFSPDKTSINSVHGLFFFLTWLIWGYNLAVSLLLVLKPIMCWASCRSSLRCPAPCMRKTGPSSLRCPATRMKTTRI